MVSYPALSPGLLPNVYFEKMIVEDTWYVLGPTCALEIDLTLRDLFAREQN